MNQKTADEQPDGNIIIIWVTSNRWALVWGQGRPIAFIASAAVIVIYFGTQISAKRE